MWRYMSGLPNPDDYMGGWARDPWWAYMLLLVMVLLCLVLIP